MASPFAPNLANLLSEQQVGAMGKKIGESERKRLRDRSHRGRSEVYRFIRWNLADLQADGFGTDKGPSWDDLAETINRRKITNQRGERVTGDAVRKVFARAVRDAALEPPPQEAAVPSHRSRQRGDWSPPITGAAAPAPATVSAYRATPEHYRREDSPPSPRPEPPPPTPVPSTTGSSPLDDLPPEVKAKFDRLRQAFAETDRKRFGRY
jgi:hypothetical protein